MKTKVLLAAVLLAALLNGCQKENTSSEETIAVRSNDLDMVRVESASLGERISLQNQLIIWENADLDRTLTPSNDIIWTYVADMNPLNFQGQDLSATHIEVIENYAIISYHVRGNEHLGGIEVLNISNAEDPWVSSQVFFEESDINSISLSPNSTNNNITLWTSISDKNKGAVLAKMSIVNGIIQNDYNYINLSEHLNDGISASANSVNHVGDYLYVSSGKTHGGVFCFNASSLEYLGHSSFSNCKSVMANGNNEGSSKVVSLQTGDNASIKVSNLGQHNFSTVHSISPISHQNTDAPYQGKNNFQFHPNDPDLAYIAMGSGGLHVYNIINGNLIYSTPPGFLDRGNSNGLSFSEDLFYVANGADGLAVFSTPENPSEEPQLIFTWDLGETEASANYVKSKNEWVFIAKGQGGVKILRQPNPGSLQALSAYDNQGVPENLAEDQDVCSTLLPEIFSSALPEGQNALLAHPEYFQDNVIKEIFIEEDAEVLMTFLHEGAGYRNTLGYYYYNADTPPSSPNDLAQIVIFPNASASGSGGNLVPGNTMKLLGSFDANTVIGFFLISNGWQNGGITNGIDTQYTISEFNDYQNTQTIIFHDNTCDATVVCFEDINVTSGGDKDFNDAIFQIRSVPSGAISVENYLEL